MGIFHQAGQIVHIVHFHIENASAYRTFGMIVPVKPVIKAVWTIGHFQLLNFPVLRQLIEVTVYGGLADMGVMNDNGIIDLFRRGMRLQMIHGFKNQCALDRASLQSATLINNNYYQLKLYIK